MRFIHKILLLIAGVILTLIIIRFTIPRYELHVGDNFGYLYKFDRYSGRVWLVDFTGGEWAEIGIEDKLKTSSSAQPTESAEELLRKMRENR